MFDCWGEYQKQFIKPTADERVQEYLSNVGKTIPSLKDVADACKCDIATVSKMPSWRNHVKKRKSLPAKERVANFLNAVMNDPEKYTAQQVARQCKCSPVSVQKHDKWRQYQKKLRPQPAEQRIGLFLSKIKTGRKRYTRKMIADKLGLGKNTLICSQAWQKYKNEVTRTVGQQHRWGCLPSAGYCNGSEPAGSQRH